MRLSTSVCVAQIEWLESFSKCIYESLRNETNLACFLNMEILLSYKKYGRSRSLVFFQEIHQKDSVPEMSCLGVSTPTLGIMPEVSTLVNAAIPISEKR